MGLDIDLYTPKIDISDDGADDIIIEITGLKSISKFIGLEDTPLYYDNGKFFKVEDNKIVYTNIEWKDISGDISESPEIIKIISDLVNEVASDIVDERINLHNLNTEAHPYIQNIIHENYVTLDTKIDDTKEELSQDISNLNDALNQEISDRETADNALSEDIQEEILARIEGDATLQGEIDTLNTNLQNEIDARIEGDTNLSNSLDELSNNLIQEVLDRQEQDSILQEQITSNYNTLDDKIDTEISNRTSADTTLQGNIDAEALARQNADTTLQNNIDELTQTVEDNNTAVNSRIDETNDTVSDLSDTVTSNYNTLDDKINTEISDRTSADTTLQNNIDAEASTRQDADSILQGNIDTLSDTVSSNYTTLDGKITNLTSTVNDNYTELDGRITTNTNNISTINSKIPNQASSSNQLADKDFVNSSIATNTANFIGTFNSVAELEAYSGTLTNNDYAFVATIDSVGNTLYDRYKYSTNTQEWLFEYELNNSSFTAVQWASINSGATTENINQITTNTNNITDLQTNKQDKLTAGANIQINNNVISATDTTYTAGSGISIENNVISNTQTSAVWGNIQGTLSDQTDLQTVLNSKQDNLVSGENIKTINSTSILGSGNISVATSAQGALADTALQPNDNISELTNDANYITSADLPIVNNGVLTIQVNGDNLATFSANQAGNTTANIVVPDSATWGNITGTLSNQTDLQNALNDKYDASNPDGFISSASISSLTDVGLTSVVNNQALLYNSTTQKWENKDVIITVDTALDNTSTNPVENRVIAQALEEISLAKNPNLNLIGGNLNIDSGNVSGFSTTDYMQFPFVFNFNGYHWTLEMGFTTGSTVTTQQNLIDSYYGIAFAIRNGKFVLAISSNGSSWDIANVDGTYSVQANTAYSVKIAWDGTNYTLSYALDETNYTTDIAVTSALVHHSTQEYVGGEPDLYGSGHHPFSGTINLNNWKLTVNGLEVWFGMDDVGLGSRANIDLSNLTEAGLAKFQAPLISGTNIKTINNNSILGSGNIDIDSLPSQTGQSGKFLTTDGTDASWATVTIPTPTYDSTNERITW